MDNMGKTGFGMILAVTVGIAIFPWFIAPLGMDIQGTEFLIEMLPRLLFLFFAFGLFFIVRKKGMFLGLIYITSPMLGMILSGMGVGKTMKPGASVKPEQVSARLQKLAKERAVAQREQPGETPLQQTPKTSRSAASMPRMSEPAPNQQDAQIKEPSAKPLPHDRHVQKVRAPFPKLAPESDPAPIKRGARYDNGPIVSTRGFFGGRRRVS